MAFPDYEVTFLRTAVQYEYSATRYAAIRYLRYPSMFRRLFFAAHLIEGDPEKLSSIETLRRVRDALHPLSAPTLFNHIFFREQHSPSTMTPLRFLFN